jgi:hypothetical protein
MRPTGFCHLGLRCRRNRRRHGQLIARTQAENAGGPPFPPLVHEQGPPRRRRLRRRGHGRLRRQPGRRGGDVHRRRHGERLPVRPAVGRRLRPDRRTPDGSSARASTSRPVPTGSGTSRCSRAPSRVRGGRRPSRRSATRSPRPSGLLAALDSAHPEHKAANEATRELGSEAALSAVDDLRRWMSRGRVVLPEITEHHLGAAQSVRVRYRALDLDRRDFRAVRPPGRHKAFRILSDDLPLRRGALGGQLPPPSRGLRPGRAATAPCLKSDGAWMGRVAVRVGLHRLLTVAVRSCGW